MDDLPISNLKAELHNINAMHIPSLVKIHWYLLKLSSRNEQTCHGQITLSKIDEICPSAIPNEIFTISMHTPSLVKIHWHLLKLSSGNENSDILLADNSVKNWLNLPINNPKPDLYNINEHTKFRENPLTFTQVIIWKCKYRRTDWGTTDGQMDGQTDRYTHSQRDTIIPRHYRVAGYKP